MALHTNPGWRRKLRGAVCAALVLCAAKVHANQIESAYFNGQLVRFEVVQPQKKQKGFRMGPWTFGVRVANPKPSDRRLNLYLVCPGEQHRAKDHEAFDHNDVINVLPKDDDAVEWDVYWAAVLDPALDRPLHSEQDLLLETQETFAPPEDFKFEQIPSAEVLKTFLKVRNLAGLERYRRPDGRLPRLIIVPAGFAVRAKAAPVEPEDEPATESAASPPVTPHQ